ncbi:MAG: cytochrome c, partial [Verrucomicrobiota bacterium]
PQGVAQSGAGALTKAEQIQAGRRLFGSICAACHQPTGQGRAINSLVFGRLGEVVVNGAKDNNNMPSFPLNDQDMANVMTFVYNSFGNSALDVTPDEVKFQRTKVPAPAATPAVKSVFE